MFVSMLIERMNTFFVNKYFTFKLLDLLQTYHMLG